MAYVKVWIHTVWGTKRRHPYLIAGVKEKVIAHIKENAKEKDIYIDTINGHTDHLHALISINPDMSISKAMQLIKGESAFWINREEVTNEHFEWADEYFAVSVSESALNKVREYIKNQEEHHSKVTFMEEYNKFIKAYKFGG